MEISKFVDIWGTPHKVNKLVRLCAILEIDPTARQLANCATKMVLADYRVVASAGDGALGFPTSAPKPTGLRPALGGKTEHHRGQGSRAGVERADRPKASVAETPSAAPGWEARPGLRARKRVRRPIAGTIFLFKAPTNEVARALVLAHQRASTLGHKLESLGAILPTRVWQASGQGGCLHTGVQAPGGDVQTRVAARRRDRRMPASVALSGSRSVRQTTSHLAHTMATQSPAGV